MGLNCGCPAGAHLADLTINDCKESLGQLQKIVIQRIFSAAGTRNSIAAPTSKATWTALMSAADGTKTIVSPYIQNPETTPGAARTFGGGNQTLGGQEIIIGREPTNFTGVIYQESQSTIKTMKEYQCEEIGIYLIDENGNIACLAETTTSGSTTTTTYYPIPVRRFFIGDKSLGGFEEPDSNAIEWSFMPNWSDKLVILKRSELDFDPLTELVNAASA